MKRAKKTSIVSKLLLGFIAFVTAFSSMPMASVSISAQTSAPEDKEIVWSSTFDSSEGFLESTLDETKGSSNIRGYVAAEKVKGDVSSLVDLDSLSGTNNHNSNETKDKLFDGDSGTKWLAWRGGSAPSEEDPMYIQFKLSESVVIDRYAIVSANDAQERDPKNWRLEASVDGEEWVVLDTQSDQVFNNRYQLKEYTIENTTSYAYYKYVITGNYGNSGMLQFADILLGTGVEKTYETTPMDVKISSGPSGAWNQLSNKGWDDSYALEVSGTHLGSEDAHSWNVIYKDLDITVDAYTNLSYVIFPALIDGIYDYNYTQMNMAVDLKFSDGTYLSDYAIKDTNGDVLTPSGQCESRALLTNQWNKITARLGENTVLQGKVIKEVLVAYDNKDNKAEGNVDFKTYFDCIEVYRDVVEEYTDVADYVSILRGTNNTPNFSRGLTAPIVATPFGANFWSPVTNSNDNNLYTYQQNGSTGTLKHIQVGREASYWVGDRGNWEFMINTSIDPAGNESIGTAERAATFSHDNEVAKAHYYSVSFTEGNAANSQLELSPTEHGAIVRFTFDDEASYNNVILDIVRGGSKQVTLNEDGKSFTAYSNNNSNGLKTMYVYGEFDTAWTNVSKYGNSNQNSAILNFGDTNVVTMRVATSFISAEQAKHNLELELYNNNGAKSFDTVFNEAKAIWNDQLDVITVEGASYEEKVTLYSNLYRLFIYPNLLSENTGTNENPVWKYKSTVSDEVKEGRLFYNNGFWDTYHTTWAAYSLLCDDAQYEDLLNGLVEHYNDGGWVPRWVAPGGTNSMVGTSSDIIFADSAVKGADFDLETAYLSALKNATVVNVENLTSGGRAELNTSIFRGYTTNSTGEGFSWSMEGYINDYGLSQMATILSEQALEAGDNEKAEQYATEAEYFANRALNYVLLFDEGDGENVETMWFKGKNANGEWSQGDSFNPQYWGSDYTETDAYNMLVTVPQDGNGLANLYGGYEALGERMDTIFTTTSSYYGYGATAGNGGIHEQREAREVKLGVYGHSNQPSHGIIYMYNYAKQPWKTQALVRDVLDRCYVGGDFGQGYIGDEDNGEASGWYVLSALGIFPVSMGSGEYAIGSPLYDKVTVDMGDGKTLEIEAVNNSDENVYIQSMSVNNKSYNSSFISHETLKEGGKIKFYMGSEPNEYWGISGQGTSLTEGSEVANPEEDLTIANVSVADSVSSIVYKDTVTGNDVNDIKNLFDNNSNNVATFAEETEITYSFVCPVSVNMLTLTSTKDKQADAPEAYVLYGSNDGTSWTEIAKEEDITFAWGRQTRPFSVGCEDKYSHYKLVLTGGTTLSEIELIGQNDSLSNVSKEVLANTVVYAESLNAVLSDGAYDKILEAPVAAAKDVLANDNATQEEITAAYETLYKAIERAENVRDGFVKIEAETYDMNEGIVNDGPNIGGVQKNEWVGYKDVEFAYEPDEIEVYYSVQNSDGCKEGYIEVRLDSRDGEALVSIPTTHTGGWGNYVITTAEIPEEVRAQFVGLHDVYFTFVGKDADKSYVANVDYMLFKGEAKSVSLGVSEDSDKEAKVLYFTAEEFVKYLNSNGEEGTPIEEAKAGETVYFVIEVAEGKVLDRFVINGSEVVTEVQNGVIKGSYKVKDTDVMATVTLKDVETQTPGTDTTPTTPGTGDTTNTAGLAFVLFMSLGVLVGLRKKKA